MQKHTHSAEAWQHDHSFLGEDHERNERKTRIVIAITVIMMLAEIIGGTWLGSMALVADGWHMSTHAGALGIAAFAYMYARRHRNDPQFAFGTGKLGDLAAFASAIILGIICLMVIFESVERILSPVPIVFGEAIAVATLGFVVNIVSAWMLHDEGGHNHGHGDGHVHHHDNNMRSAYIHVLADAATSVLAIIGLLAGWLYGWVWMDPVMGIVGALVIANWSVTLMRASGRVLLDVIPDKHLTDTVRKRLETGGDTITDFHLWQMGPGNYAAIISLLSDAPQAPAAYKAKLSDLREISHITIEVLPCEEGMKLRGVR